MTEHAKLSASGAHRWMHCPASIRLEADFPDKFSPHAAEGTAAHELAGQCLKGVVNADTYLNDNVAGFDVGQEMVDAVQIYIDYVRLCRSASGGELLIEQRVDFSPWVPGGFGTADAVILGDGIATVVDLKYGKGVRVDAPYNPQAMLYALGTLNDHGYLYDIDAVRVAIVQPRLDHIDEWTVDTAELLAWAEAELQPAAAKALSPEAAPNPGEDACRFCRAKGACTALAEHNLSLVAEGFDNIADCPPPTQADLMADDMLGQVLPHLSSISKWIDAVRAEATSRLKGGGSVPGYKLVQGRSQRRWGNEEVAAGALRKKLKVADIYPKKLISPAQAEKLLGKGNKIIEAHTIQPEGSPTLVPESDKRPAVDMDPAAGFEAVDAA